MMRLFRILTSVLCAAAFLSSCVTIPAEEKELSVTLNEHFKELAVGETFQLEYEVTSYDFDTVWWRNSNPDVVDVALSGLVTGLADGTAEIVIDVDRKVSDTCRFVVGTGVEVKAR